MDAIKKLKKLRKEREKVDALSSGLDNIPHKHILIKNPFKKKIEDEKEKTGIVEEKTGKNIDQKKIFEKKKAIVLPAQETKQENNIKPVENKKKVEIKTIKKEEIKKPATDKPIKNKKSSSEQRRFFLSLINKAGIDSSFSEINNKILFFDGITVSVVCFFLIISFLINKSFLSDALILLFSVAVVGFVGLFLLIWGGFFIFVDFKIYQRRKEIEEVFPDFLQLTAANINAGMPIDRSLWFAIRPRFGILAKEMETVAKSTMVGESLSKALIDFSNKYDSVVIKRALNLLLEGLESGGEIGELLTKISDNMRDTEIMKKEMASSVTTYVIFILAATIGAAPFLFGLTTELIVIMTSIMSQIQVGEGTQSMGGMGMSMGGDSISVGDYQIFAILSICISSIFAAIITSVIQKGSAKEALRNIPVYILISLIVYFISFKALNLLLGGFFG